MKRPRGKTVKIVLLTMAATVAATMLALNFVTGEKKIDERIEPLYGVSEPQFLRSMGSLLGPAIGDGNRIDGLQNGDEIFPAMLARHPRGAEARSPSRPTSTGRARSAREFAEALAERARAGVKVHVLLDWVGSGKMDAELLEDDGGRGRRGPERYHPLRWYNLSRINNRTHRKLLVVDGRVGFTGGVGIADQWLGHAQDARALARLALPPGGPGGRADAGGVHGQLDEDDGRGPARRGLLPDAEPRRATRWRRSSAARPARAARACG